MSMRSPLAQFAHLSQEPDPARAWDLCRDAWHTHGIVCIDPNELERRNGWVQGRMIRTLGEQAFGKRKEPKA